MSLFSRTFKSLRYNLKVSSAIANINEVMIYKDGKLNDNEWFYADYMYIIGDITKEEVAEGTKALHPDAAEYVDADDSINKDERLRIKN